MFCRKCGAPNGDNAYKCTSCGDVLQTVATMKIENYLVLAIVVTVLCCMPFGIVGIVYAAQVNARAQAGDIVGAEDSARKARLWSYWGLGLGLVLYAVYAALGVTGALAERASQ